MDVLLYTLAGISVCAFGYVVGRAHGYIDAQPKRDNTGRFTKRD